MRYCLRIASLAILFSALTSCVPLSTDLPEQALPVSGASPSSDQLPTPNQQPPP